MRLNTVATNLLGRWVKGRWWHKNPEYVHPQGGFLSYTSKQLKTLTDVQMQYWAYEDLTGQVVAVTSDGEQEFQKLVFWIIVDGQTRKLQDCSVMPEGWAPEISR
jgi:hypothetical protein